MEKDPYLIEFPTFSATIDEEGKWIYKSKPVNAKKKNGTLKAGYKDLPRVKAIYTIEKAMNSQFKKTIDASMKEINKKLIDFSRVKS